ncbi:glutamate receptor 3.2-like [Cryptomeria japonica]|uniref:glutamate receptor 3.2-like n=1 Tax=Cryptomeria japonica TaxID=3369 RepID=UPI0027DA66BD|nr:glutamate receptor 3.2-like [Cryptomeria japonica]
MSPACGSCDVWRNSVRPLILFLLVFVELYDARPPEVRIGGVFDLGSYQGKQSNAAIQLAIQDVNNNPNILNETILEIQTTKIGSSALIDAENVLKLFRANVVSVVAPMTAQVSNFVSVLADSAQVPLITFAGNDPSMSLKQSAYSIQMIGRDVLQMKAIAVLLNKFHWREIVVIYQEDELGLSGILALKNALQETSARIVQKFGVSEESFSNSSWKHIRKTLKENKIRSRAFVIHTSYGLAQKIFLEAKTSGIMEKRGWAWIVTEWVANYLDVPDDTTMDSMQGIIGVRTKARQTPQYKNISKRCNHEFMRLYPNVTHSEDIGIVGAYAYDSIWVIAKAIDTMFRVNKLTELEFKSSEKFSTDVHVFQGGNALLQKVAQSNFEGIGGNIKFSKNRLLEVESYDIVNVVNREIRVVGSWAKKEFKLKDNIEWPNGSPKPPSGYRKFIVGVPPHVVFPGFVNITNNNTEFEGFCIDVFKSAVEMLDYPFHYEFKVSDNGTECPDYSKLVDQVVSKKFDIIVADITILAKRSAKVDFTQPYTDTGLVIMVRTKKKQYSGWAFLHPFTIPMWITAAVFVLLTAFLVWLLERDENDAFTGQPTKQMQISLW